MSQDHAQLLGVLEKLGHPRVLVLGDLIWDRYTWGDAERVSPEAPVLVLRTNQREARLGGAASVCQLLRGLDAEVTCVGVLGADQAAHEVRERLTESGIHAEHVLADPSRPTTVKERFIGLAQNRHPHQILRVDSEERMPLSAELERELLARTLRELPQHQAVLISDYNKGVCTPTLVQAVIKAARELRIPVLADPVSSADFRKYHGATYLTPNRAEAQAATGRKLRRNKDALLMGRDLCTHLNLRAAIITLDRDGMALVPPDGAGIIYPTRPRNVYDITGAGDMVLAALGLCVAEGVPLSLAVPLANVAGGLEVERVGVVPITREDLRTDLRAGAKVVPYKVVDRSEIRDCLEQHQARGQRVVFTNGCFDLLHIGHVTALQEAAELGEVLVVGLNSDQSVSRLKGTGRPIVAQQHRADTLAGLGCVDYVVIFDEDTPLELIHEVRPDVLVKGGGYDPREIVGREFVESNGGRVCVTSHLDGVSTTQILSEAVRRQEQLVPRRVRATA